MADLAKAKQAAAKVGMQPPSGITDGTPEYDNWVQQWFDAGVAAGDPRLTEIAGPQPGSTQAEEGGTIADWKNAAPSSEWMGKRKPNAQEVRRWAIETGRSEDYKRFPDQALSGWIERNWDVGKGGFFNNYGDPVDKPDERAPNTPAGVNGTGDKGNWTDGPGGGGSTGGGQSDTPAAPPQPVTFGSQLSMTGNAMQDMLIGQFNSGQDSNTYQNNLFGLGEDRAVGGTGRNADQGSTAPTRQAQSLGGGGLWWGQDKDTFAGFDASQKNADGTPTASPGAKAETPVAAPATPAAPTTAPVNGPGKIGGMYTGNPNKRRVVAPYQGFRNPQQPSPISGMVTNQFSNPARQKPSYF